MPGRRAAPTRQLSLQRLSQAVPGHGREAITRTCLPARHLARIGREAREVSSISHDICRGRGAGRPGRTRGLPMCAARTGRCRDVRRRTAREEPDCGHASRPYRWVPASVLGGVMVPLEGERPGRSATRVALPIRPRGDGTCGLADQGSTTRCWHRVGRENGRSVECRMIARDGRPAGLALSGSQHAGADHPAPRCLPAREAHHRGPDRRTSTVSWVSGRVRGAARPKGPSISARAATTTGPIPERP